MSDLSVDNRILGNDTFAAITAVEGIALGSASRVRLASMRERHLTHGEQRAEIIRALSTPAIGPERDLFEVVPGGSDKKIEAQTPVEMRSGLRFFTAPAQINPGR